MSVLALAPATVSLCERGAQSAPCLEADLLVLEGAPHAGQGPTTCYGQPSSTTDISGFWPRVLLNVVGSPAYCVVFSRSTPIVVVSDPLYILPDAVLFLK